MGLHIDFLAAGRIRDMSHPAATKRKARTFLARRDKERALVLLRCWLSDTYYDVRGRIIGESLGARVCA